MININFETYEELEKGIGLIEPNEFFEKIMDFGITVKNVMFENLFCGSKLCRKMTGYDLKEIIEELKKEYYDNPSIEIVRNYIDDELFIGLTLFDTYEKEYIKYEWLVF